MHIVFITSEYPILRTNHGGVGSFVQNLSKHLSKNNITVSVVGVYDVEKERVIDDENVKVYGLPQSKWKIGKFYQNTLRIINKLKEIDKEETIDIVEGAELSFAFFPKKTSYKKVIRLHGGHHFFAIELNKKPAFWRGFQEKQSFKKADSFVAVSNYVGTQTQKYLNCHFPFTTIYNSVDIQKFKPTDNSKVIPNSLLYVGTVCEKKGIRQLVQAMPYIKKEIPNVHLKIVGRDWFFPNGDSYITYLKKFITKDIEDIIEIVGVVPHTDVPRFIEQAQVCVYPSHMESFGLTVLETLLMEKPVVCSSITPFLEIRGNKEILKVTKVAVVKELAETIVKVLKDFDKSKDMGKLARKDIQKRFNVSTIINQNIEFYKKTLLIK